MDSDDDDIDQAVALYCVQYVQRKRRALEAPLDQVPRRANRERNHIQYGALLDADFWGPSPVYDAREFKALFRLPVTYSMRFSMVFGATMQPFDSDETRPVVSGFLHDKRPLARCRS